uniref:FHA domain-containing protein n=1 Tax=Meloidogyne javanica TaxID=6303 RepID=A0A915LPK7_MELJA
MLRREGSNKKVDENILLLQNTLIGSDPNCDIVIKCSGVRPKHAVIEYSQKTSSFWLRQLIPTFNEELGEQKRTSPENENKIEEAVNGSLIELRPLDKLRFGNGPESRSSSSIGYSSAKKKTSPDQKHFSLPIVGKHIQPKPYVDRFARPVQSNTTTLRRSASTSRIIAINSRNSNSTEGGNDTDRKGIETTSEREDKRKVEQNLQENQSGKEENEILQNNLIKEALNQENIRSGIDNEEEEEINSENNTIKNNRFEDSENSFQEALARAHEENERLREELLKNDFVNNKKGKKKVFSSVNEIVFETFFKVCNEEMEILNRRLVNMSVRDYSDIFAEINKILHEPFSFRLMEINSKCSILFESLKLESSEKEELYIQLDRFLKEKIYPISKAVDSFLGTLRESALIAKESARACSVFSQWSREFGDQLQLHPDWNLMIYKVRDLQNRFREQGLPRHWLPPSLMPLLEVLIFERKNWADEGQKKEHELAESLKEANEKIKKLEAELEKRSLNGPQNPLQKINRIIQKDSKERANSIPLIRLPVSNDSSSPTKNSDEFNLPRGQRSPRGEKKQQSPRSPRKPLISPRTPRSARSSRGSFRLASGASEEYESSQQHSPHQEAHVDSPHTPPPSYRVRSVLGARPLPALELRALVEAAKVEKENQDNEDELPWGDKIPEPIEEEEKKSERNIEEAIDDDDIENHEITKIDLSIPVEETSNGENEMMEIRRESPNRNTENGDDHNEMFENENGTLLESDKTTPLRDSTKILSENDLENKSDEHNDQEEFEKIEKEILFQTKDENNILNKTKQDNKKGSPVLIPSKATRYKTFEFWGFAHSLANILNMELPSREAIKYQFYNSLSRPQSADEFDARLKAVDSIQEKLKLMMNEVKKVQNENGTS